jgi:starch synthase (maltosyl-transferring)
VAIENVSPEIDGGRFAVKRVVGDVLTVEADAFTDGHDEIRVVLGWCEDDCLEWREVEMEHLGNDRWRASFPLAEIGRYQYTVSAWVDHWETWRHDLKKRVDAGQDVTVDLQIGSGIVASAADRAAELAVRADAEELREAASRMTADLALGSELDPIVEQYPDRAHETTLEQPLSVVVDPERARFSAWYELFPRSASPDPKRHGTFQDVINRLDYVKDLGFDVLYLPPIHPIGRQFRKGPNNQPSGSSLDPGVPWAIGGATGGHTAVHPELGDLASFERLVHEARRRGIEVALDIAFQASPDHPWVKEHPEWFRARPDGTIQYAENPPKKYQDIYPFDFDSADWRGLWDALNDVFRYWIAEGVTVFRVDNPHTKSFAFWEWAINDIKSDHPQVLFLAEAFTRPKIMYRLAKLGFSQSYTYFTWRNSAWEMREYLRELTSPPVGEFFRPNFWPNTPDILHADLQTGGRAAFETRFLLAATLSSSYGIYGPAYELGESVPRDPGTEEYLDSEKYQQRTWDLDAPHSLRDLIARVNRARHEHPALQSNEGLLFHPIDNPHLLAYTKHSPDRKDVILAIANLDFHSLQRGVLQLALGELGLPLDRPYQVIDLLDDTSTRWPGSSIPIALEPAERGAQLLWLKP